MSIRRLAFTSTQLFPLLSFERYVKKRESKKSVTDFVLTRETVLKVYKILLWHLPLWRLRPIECWEDWEKSSKDDQEFELLSASWKVQHQAFAESGPKTRKIVHFRPPFCVSLQKHSVWKLLKLSYFNFLTLAFFINFCPIKSVLSGKTIWPQITKISWLNCLHT